MQANRRNCTLSNLLTIRRLYRRHLHRQRPPHPRRCHRQRHQQEQQQQINSSLKSTLQETANRISSILSNNRPTVNLTFEWHNLTLLLSINTRIIYLNHFRCWFRCCCCCCCWLASLAITLSYHHTISWCWWASLKYGTILTHAYFVATNLN